MTVKIKSISPHIKTNFQIKVGDQFEVVEKDNYGYYIKAYFKHSNREDKLGTVYFEKDEVHVL